MSIKKTIKKIQRFCNHLNGSTIQFDCSEYVFIVDVINSKKNIFSKYTDDEIKRKIDRLKMKVATGNLVSDECMIDIFAIIAVVVQRVLHIVPFNVQLAGAIALHKGKLVEMQTGEGKTITALFAACLNAFGGRGVHVITFNDYLAKRDREWMKPVYDFIGLSTGVITERVPRSQRNIEYNCDITYSTAREIGYDYLRDCLVYNRDNTVLRPFNFAIVDEADSIMIDEARIPLIVAGDAALWGDSVATDDIKTRKNMVEIVKDLQCGKDYNFDQYKRNVFLTEDGVGLVEHRLKCGNIYEEKNRHLLSLLHYALHAEKLLCKGRDYIVRNDMIEIVDEFTGRVVRNRKWPEGLQDALEAREGLSIQNRGVILGTTTMQHFFQLYPSLAAMTATAQGSQEEFRSIYNLHIVIIPPNRKSVRIDCNDHVSVDKRSKWEAVAGEICVVHATGRPVLVGTLDIGETTLLSRMLDEKGIVCQILNAENDACEAQIIADAGKFGAVTISTNMAGRGTDIKLGGTDQREHLRVAALGGLYVIGTNRHESIRIDNQLRGRAGRQGDPGSTRFFISLEDDIFEKYKLKELLSKSFFKKKSNEQLASTELHIEINRVQRIIEGQHCDIKLTLYKYSQLIESQRKEFVEFRDNILQTSYAGDICADESPDIYRHLKSIFSEEEIVKLCTFIILRVIDKSWVRYLEEISVVKDSIHLRKYGKQDPIFEFKSASIKAFNQMMKSCEMQIVEELSTLVNVNSGEARGNINADSTSSTWTYLISDDPFRDKSDVLISADHGFSAWSGFNWPLLILWYFIKPGVRNK